ncbi:MAG: CCA tRNA nucleotidyltransferase, partial [Pseudomonadota bacterium]
MRLVADWLQRPALVALIDALSTDGPAPRLVGGCVRDGLLGRSVADIDLATPLPPEAVIVALESADIRVVPTGIDHGTVTAVIDGVGYEVTTLRRDVATDGRRAVVAFTDDWRGDAARRDFTMNAMSSEPDGTLHDYFGGAADARNGVVRFVGDPATRIAEDYLRVPRFFRFMAWYGRSAPPEDVMRAISASIPKLDGLVAERVRAELLRWLGAPDPRWSWDLAESAGLAIWLFGDVDTARFNRLVGREIDRGLPAESLRRLAALALPPGPGSTETANRFRLSRAEARYLAALEAAVPAARQALTADDARRLAYRSGPAVARD